MLPHILGCAVLAASVAAQLSGNVVTLDCKSHPLIDDLRCSSLSRRQFQRTAEQRHRSHQLSRYTIRRRACRQLALESTCITSFEEPWQCGRDFCTFPYLSARLRGLILRQFPAACLQTTTEIAEADIVFKYTSDAMDGYSEDCLFLNVRLISLISSPERE